jgi:hypothetical protein
VGNLGCGCAAVAALLALVTALPLLGWANWLATIPVALIAVIISVVGLSRKENTGAATLGLVAGMLVLFWALFRLALGGGVL